MHNRAILLLVVLAAAPFAQAGSWRPAGEYWLSLEPKERSQLAHGMILGLMMANLMEA